eukprot:CAMPEP_0180697620 /NCGR_PEP_ID=MMETSP1038_2-20121128/3594_1 /TAXON_ID=632150 /ORGANISM="Azadinium spinosum, Strain 3D9" /LENGTH=517 /DNA_ID=CAMNT_0022729147 /DNA_START=73 /DNA_END=1623 /DNA_ORIENTATION=+
MSGPESEKELTSLKNAGIGGEEILPADISILWDSGEWEQVEGDGTHERWKAWYVKHAKKNPFDFAGTFAAAEELIPIVHDALGIEQSNDQELTSTVEVLKKLFPHAMKGGGWDAAMTYRKENKEDNPFMILVDGIWGSRKSSTMCNPQLAQMLQVALKDEKQKLATAERGDQLVVAEANPEKPPAKLQDLEKHLTNLYQAAKADTKKTGAHARSISGGTAFFRQLDFFIAGVSTGRFRALLETYSPEPAEFWEAYAKEKSKIFRDFRFIAECWMWIAMKAAVANNLNCIVEGSGTHVGVHTLVDAYLNTLATRTDYQRLWIHFDVLIPKLAAASVEERFKKELEEFQYLKRQVQTPSKERIDQINSGGAGYGEANLEKAQEANMVIWRDRFKPIFQAPDGSKSNPNVLCKWPAAHFIIDFEKGGIQIAGQKLFPFPTVAIPGRRSLKASEVDETAPPGKQAEGLRGKVVYLAKGAPAKRSASGGVAKRREVETSARNYMEQRGLLQAVQAAMLATVR